MLRMAKVLPPSLFVSLQFLVSRFYNVILANISKCYKLSKMSQPCDAKSHQTNELVGFLLPVVQSIALVSV